MARVGQEMVNPVTRERFVWHHTAGSTGGEYAECDLFLGAEAVVAARHCHPAVREDFRIERGEFRLRIGDSEERLTPGDERTVPPGVAHEWRNVGEGDAHVVLRFTPPLRIEDFFETFCGLARDGKVNGKGLPRNPLQLAVWSFAFRREAAFPARWQRALALPLVAALAAIGRLAGLKPRYEKYSG